VERLFLQVNLNVFPAKRHRVEVALVDSESNLSRLPKALLRPAWPGARL
jgi:hypothetical protein